MKTKNVKLFSLDSNLSSFPSYAICAVSRSDDNELRGESFLLAIFKGKKAKLVSMEITLCGSPDDTCLPMIDEAFVLEECLNQAKLNMLEIAKNKTPRYDFSPLPFIRNVTEVSIDYLFHGIFAQEAIQNKVRTIGDISKIDELKSFIEIVAQCERFSFSPITA